MAIKVRDIPSKGKGEMTLEDFKKWLCRFDGDHDGRVSKEELKHAMRVASKGWFCRFKSKRGVRYADANGNGFIDDDEVIYLRAFAGKHLGIRVVDY